MPCSDSSSGINLYLDRDERLITFEFAKATCSGEIDGETGLKQFCEGKTLQEILDIDFSMLVSVLHLNHDEERSFVLYLEWDALRCAIVQYLGIELDGVDQGRCHISGITHTEEGVEINQIILPPKELPKILPCSKK